MELDDLKPAWRELNQKLDLQIDLNLRLLREGRADRAHRSLRPLAWGQMAQILAGGLLSLAAGAFWVAHRQVPHLLATGLLMHAYGLAMILVGARTQVLLHRLDFSAPVLEIQTRLAQLRRFYILGGLWLGLPWWFLWIPALLMAFMALFGADLAAKLPSLILLVHLAAGLAGALLTLLFIQWARRRPALIHRLERAAAGRSLNEVQRVLDDLAAFERE